jgi:hypothetical protein
VNENITVTVSQVLDGYEAACLHELAPRTQRDYRRHLIHLRRRFGHLDANKLKPRDFGPFLTEIPPGKKGRVQRVRQLAVLSAAFTYAVSFSYQMELNPLRQVKRPRFKPRDRYVTDAEYDGVRAMAPLRVRLAMEIAYLTGQRQGDVIGLKWGARRASGPDHDEARLRSERARGRFSGSGGVSGGPELNRGARPVRAQGSQMAPGKNRVTAIHRATHPTRPDSRAQVSTLIPTASHP